MLKHLMYCILIQHRIVDKLNNNCIVSNVRPTSLDLNAQPPEKTKKRLKSIDYTLHSKKSM